MNSKTIEYLDLGLIPYNEAFDLQLKEREKLMQGERSGLILFCEHEPVFTLGKQDVSQDWLSPFSDIKGRGIDVVKCNRGGRITYHGPGQLVVYFILNILDHASGVKDFVSLLEEACIDMLSQFDLKASKKEKYPGIWIKDEKIIAIGLHISSGVSMHGIAINVNTNLGHYNHIIPCGIKEFGITSFKKLLGDKSPDINKVKQTVKESLERRLK